eukprot:Protomagalhaensia_wolfi_Nauph_80__253@NODE_1142_length_1701_cov_8_526474_g872_i0_p1_GENE_NODE_1142_length_1701_cov_8_526474_g872_i0NODE_1142_length_1701_cov_8_526474_g872_i0_p1_ORF_typecomplete_len265_score24_65Hydrolase_4/PF12146_8/3_6e08DUF818/PF05677_12/9_1e08Abhydrolase_2/PF02230_16/1_5e06Peptidase_S9/PF00326_21/0_00019Abhydrolase_3/PF07859_13/0_019DUF1057/PF06342_12/0_15FSH1/PF03959_13/0_068Peptidase_S15/PF02129_18/0_08UPF0227/PF05728_12/0_19UPF0227/PF05728_12/2_6e03DLH/PF01738_18/0_24_NODE
MVEELRVISEMTGRHIVQFEYPGYGVCEHMRMESPSMVNQWGRAVAFFLIALGCPPNSIVPFGRSIGTGPAALLARTLTDIYGVVGGLILHSPYLSIHSLVADYATKFGTLFVENFWDSKAQLAVLARYQIPFLCVHGRADEVIGVRHGIELFDTYMVPPAFKLGVFPLTSEHNAYVVMDDLVNPIRLWLAQSVDMGQLRVVDLQLPDYTRKRSARMVEATPPAPPPQPAAIPGSLTNMLLCGCSIPSVTEDGSPPRPEDRTSC